MSEQEAAANDVSDKVTPCPRCAEPTTDLRPVESGMKLALQAAGLAEAIPSTICSACHEELGGKISQGAKLRAEQVNREKSKAVLWKKRVGLVKQARQHMQHKAYSEAAVAYEKYLRVLELVFNLNKGEISPEIFNSSKRSKELTVITSVYWDLVRIYDTSPRYADRMQEAADKLAAFLPHSHIYPDVISQAEIYVRQSKNPQIVKQILRNSRSKLGRCFIATAVFDYPQAPEVQALRQFRDQKLRPHLMGRLFIRLYEASSPPLAQWIRPRARLKRALRGPLAFIARRLKDPR